MGTLDHPDRGRSQSARIDQVAMEQGGAARAGRSRAHSAGGETEQAAAAGLEQHRDTRDAAGAANLREKCKCDM